MSDGPPIRNLLVVLPTWVGDNVMATPTLRALRRGLPDARIVGLTPHSVRSTLAGTPLLDRLRTYRTAEGVVCIAKRIRSARFDAAILLSNSFRTAAMVRLAGIPRRIGYARDGRGWLLTDRARPPREGIWPRRRFSFIPTIDYYTGLLGPLGLPATGREMELAVTPVERERAERVLVASGLDAALERPADRGRPPFVLLNPGGRYGAAKLWPTRYYAQLADRLAAEWGATVAVTTAPNERRIVEEICTLAQSRVIDFAASRLLTLGAVKELCRRADLVVTNDTGTRHIAAAMRTRVITIFGPTDPRWTTLDYPWEREVFVPVECGPCQLKTCPLPAPRTLQCMWRVTPERVLNEAVSLMRPGVRLKVAS